jgi:hypothetical protein
MTRTKQGRKLELVKSEPKKPVDIVAFVDDLFRNRSVNGVALRDVFMSVANMEEFLRLFHDRAVVQASLHVPDIIETLSMQAKDGDVDAAKLVLDVAGMIPKGKGTTNAIQINITADEQAQLEKDFAGDDYE